MQAGLPYRVAYRLTWPVTNVHLFSVLGRTRGLLEGKIRPVDDVVTPLNALPPSGLTIDNAFQQTSLQGIMCHDIPKNDRFLFRNVSNSDRLVSALRTTPSIVCDTSCPVYSYMCHAPPGPHFKCFQGVLRYFAEAG